MNVLLTAGLQFRHQAKQRKDKENKQNWDDRKHMQGRRGLKVVAAAAAATKRKEAIRNKCVNLQRALRSSMRSSYNSPAGYYFFCRIQMLWLRGYDFPRQVSQEWT